MNNNPEPSPEKKGTEAEGEPGVDTSDKEDAQSPGVVEFPPGMEAPPEGHEKVMPPKRPPTSRAQKNLAMMSAAGLAVFVVILVVIYAANLFMGSRGRTIYDFERFKEGFRPVGVPEGELRITREAPGLQNEGALEYKYENEVDKFTGVGTLGADLSGFTRIKLHIRSKEDRTFVISVDEIDGGTIYVYVFELKGGEWTEISAAPEDFTLGGGQSDNNGRLDVENLNNRLVIADMSGEKGIIGKNSIWISKIEIVRGNEQENR